MAYPAPEKINERPGTGSDNFPQNRPKKSHGPFYP